MPEGRMQRGQSQTPLRDVQLQDERQWEQTEIQEVQSEHMAKHFYSESNWTLAQVSQKDIVDSLSLEMLQLDGTQTQKNLLWLTLFLNESIAGKLSKLYFTCPLNWRKCDFLIRTYNFQDDLFVKSNNSPRCLLNSLYYLCWHNYLK